MAKDIYKNKGEPSPEHEEGEPVRSLGEFLPVYQTCQDCGESVHLGDEYQVLYNGIYYGERQFVLPGMPIFRCRISSDGNHNFTE